MKEAAGELNMTVVTVIAIAAVAAFLMLVIWPQIRDSIGNQVDCVENPSAEGCS